MNPAIIIPIRADNEWRERAYAYVVAWYQKHFPKWQLIVCTTHDDEWSKGAALANGVTETDSDVFVIADADSILNDHNVLEDAVNAITIRGKSWIVPHNKVYRLKEAETERILDNPKVRMRLGHTCRTPYLGPPGGGITVLTREAWETVGGVDPRFTGWGGEDIAFGYALQTLVAPVIRLDGRLVHLWHPHPAPNLRGSPESEELVAKYEAARCFPHRMRSVISGGEPVSPPPLDRPVTFRPVGERRILRLGSHLVRFTNRQYATIDPDEVDALRQHSAVREVVTR